MTAQARHPLANSEPAGTFGPSLGGPHRSLRTRLGAWIKTCGDYYEAAALYDQLSGLSDGELRRRGLSRQTLARDVCEACNSRAVS